MPTMMTDLRNALYVASGAQQAKPGSLAKPAPSRRNPVSRGRPASRWHLSADAGAGKLILPAIDGSQQMFVVLVVPRDMADFDGATLSQPAEHWPVMGRPESSSADLGLTARQRDVLALMMQGKSNKAICRTLGLAETTVKNHITAIFKVLKVTNRTEAVIAANGSGWHGSSGRRTKPHAAHP